jgi:hypothetical protein
MKNHYRLISLFVAPLFASALLSSCIVPGYPDDGHYSSSGGGHVVYTSLPANYVGNAYFYNGRYYSGGNYQTGRYHDRGRAYTSRYYYQGKYYYGGNYQQHAPRTARQEETRTDQRGQVGSARSHDRRNGQVSAGLSRY